MADNPDEGVISQDPRDASKPDRNLAMELVRVTEAGALAAGRWIGLGEKESADGAAVDAMRLMLDTVPMDGVVVIGEGEKDEAPMLYNGEEIGDGSPPVCDIAVDPLEGTTLTARGMPSALSVIALSARGTTWMRRLGDHSDAFASGLMRVRGVRRQRAFDRGIRTYVIAVAEEDELSTDHLEDMANAGIGTPNGEILIGDGWSMRVRLDEEALKSIAEITRGEYFYAGTAQDLKGVYESLTSKLVLETRETEITAIFVIVAVMGALLSALLSMLWFNKVL